VFKVINRLSNPFNLKKVATSLLNKKMKIR
jgi:hypothetical protein